MTKKPDVKPEIEDDGDDDATPPNGSQDWEKRFRDMATRRRNAEKRVLELENEIEQHRTTAEGAGALSKRVKELESELVTKTAAWEAEGVWRDAGLDDPEGREIAEHFYNKLPEKDRASRADVAKGWREAPAKAPKAVQAYIGESGKGGGDAKGDAKAETKSEAKSEAKSEGGAGKAAGKAAPQPKSTTGTSPPATGPAATPGSDASALKAAKLKGATTGDWSEFKALAGDKAVVTPSEKAATAAE